MYNFSSYSLKENGSIFHSTEHIGYRSIEQKPFYSDCKIYAAEVSLMTLIGQTNCDRLNTQPEVQQLDKRTATKELQELLQSLVIKALTK